MDLQFNAPAPINFSDGVMERDARLLVAGNYPGKNLTVTEADLDALAANFSAPVPVKVEHVDSPLDPLGMVERVWRDGAALMGRVKFPASMAAFLAERGAAKLSCGLLKEPVWRLLEASLTLTPHVPTATLLSDGERVELAAQRAELADLRSRVRRQTESLRMQTVDAQIVALKAAGRVIPATEALARALLAADDGSLVTLSDGSSQSVAGTFLRFLKTQPPLVRLSEMANGTHRHLLSGGASGAAGLEETEEDGDGLDFSDDERELLKRLGVRPEDVRKTLKARP